MQCPVQNARGDQGAQNIPSRKGPTGIKAGRKDFWEKDCLYGHGASVCVCLSPRESWEGFFCSEDILPDPGKGSQSSSVLIAFSLIMAYPVSLLPRAPWSCSEALENTFQPGRYCVNANYCIAALKMLLRSWGGIFRQFIGAVAKCLFRELQSRLKELGFWLILPRKEI